MSDQTVFDNKTDVENNNTTPPSNDQYMSLLGEIKNEKGEQKYKTIEEALKALQHSQEYIPSLHKKLDSLQEEKNSLEKNYDRVLGIEEKLNLLLNRDNTDDNSVDKNVDDSNQDKSFDIDQIENIIERRLLQREQRTKEENNIKKVSDTLATLYQKDAYKVISDKATELGMSVDDIKTLAAKSPNAVFKMLGLKENNSAINVTSSYRSESLKSIDNSEIRKNAERLDTTSKTVDELKRSRIMVDQLKENGLSVDDLTDPRNYSKYFR